MAQGPPRTDIPITEGRRDIGLSTKIEDAGPHDAVRPAFVKSTLLVPPAHGEHTAACIPGARLEMVPGMGHDLPSVLVPKLAGLIAEHARAAEGG